MHPSEHGAASRLRSSCVRAKHLWRDGRLVWRPALESSLDGGAPLAARLASREIAADRPQIGLLFGVVFELQLGNVQFQPRRDELADSGLRRACAHANVVNAQLRVLNVQLRVLNPLVLTVELACLVPLLRGCVSRRMGECQS